MSINVEQLINRDKTIEIWLLKDYGNGALIMPIFGPYGIHWAPPHVFAIIVHCNMSNISIIL